MLQTRHPYFNPPMKELLSEFSYDRKLKVLLLEDSPDDAHFIQYYLEKLPMPVQIQRVEAKETYIIALEEFSPDIVLSDYNLPSFDGMEALELKKKHSFDVPFIFVTGFLGEERAVETLKKGASDFVLKDNISKLPQVVLNALVEAQERKKRIESELALQKSEAKYRQIIEQAADGIFVYDDNFRFLEVNAKACELLGYSKKELLQLRVNNIIPEGISIPTDSLLALRPGENLQYESLRKRQDGTVFSAEINIIRTSNGNYQAVLRDISRRMKELEVTLGKLEFHISNSPLAVIELGDSGKITRWSSQAEKMFGWRKDEAVGRDLYQLKLIHPEKLEEARNTFQSNFTASVNQFVHLEKTCTKEGTILYCEWYNSVFLDEKGKFHSQLSLVNNVTAQKLTEEAKWEGQIEERKRIARELHEGIGQMLVASKFKVASLDSSTPNLEEKINEVEGLLGLTIDEIRRISMDMAPRSVEEFGIEKAIRKLCLQVEKMTGIEVTFHYIGHSSEAPNHVLSTFYRLVQESLNNVIKHARASKVLVELIKKDKVIELIIEDNGFGFAIDKINLSRNSGMGNMKERMKLLGGQFSVSSELQKGSKIKAIVAIE